MSTPGMFVAEAVRASKVLVGRYLAGFDDTSGTRQTPHLPNHAIWSLGHCALTMHRAAQHFDGREPPAADFLLGAARGDAERFGTESVSFGSTPTDEPARYPPLPRAIAIFESACDRVADLCAAADEATLRRPVKWGPGETPLGLLCARMLFHNGMHTGQIADLRRALGFKSIFA